MSKRDWDDAFANMAHVDGSEKLPGLWSERAAAYRQGSVRIDESLAYGTDARETFDLVWPDGPPKGLAVFVHGGYWIRLDKSYWTDLAEGARQNGWAVALPQYTLAPAARLTQMTQQIGAAIAQAASMVAGPIRLAGHSAGGHLVSRMVCEDSPLPAEVLARVAQCLSISGLHDLRPLMWTQMNADLQIDEAEALRESPALLRPIAGAKVTAWVGRAERPEFIRQARLLALIWEGLEADTKLMIEDGHDHFSIIEALKQADSPITEAFAK